MPDLSGRRLCIVGSHPASTEVSPAYQELMMKCPWNRSLFLDLEFWEWILKTLTPSLQENIRHFTTHSYLTLTLQNAKLGEKRFHDFSKSLLAYIKLTTKEYLAIF